MTSPIDAIDLGLLVGRCALGIVFVAHGLNHIVGGGRIQGTGRWFESLGMRPGLLHAWVASGTEVVAGALLVVGLLTPLASAAVFGTMLVAFVINHARNGFFIFRPGEGYEYVMILCAMAFLFATTGGGRVSLDRWVGWQAPGWWGLTAILVGGFGAVVLLAACWRPATDDGFQEAV